MHACMHAYINWASAHCACISIVYIVYCQWAHYTSTSVYEYIYIYSLYIHCLFCASTRCLSNGCSVDCLVSGVKICKLQWIF